MPPPPKQMQLQPCAADWLSADSSCRRPWWGRGCCGSCVHVAKWADGGQRSLGRGVGSAKTNFTQGPRERKGVKQALQLWQLWLEIGVFLFPSIFDPVLIHHVSKRYWSNVCHAACYFACFEVGWHTGSHEWQLSLAIRRFCSGAGKGVAKQPDWPQPFESVNF